LKSDHAACTHRAAYNHYSLHYGAPHCPHFLAVMRFTYLRFIVMYLVFRPDDLRDSRRHTAKREAHTLCASRLPPRSPIPILYVMTCLCCASTNSGRSRLLLLVLVCLLLRGAAQDLQSHSRVSRFPFHFPFISYARLRLDMPKPCII
jgi:hypothetical protein